MAFHQPTRQATQRVARPVLDRTGPAISNTQHDQLVEGSQTWVLFSPGTEVTASSYLAETEASVETAGRSLQTEARSGQREDNSAIEDDVSLGEDAELDSLDSHLPEFRSLPGVLSQGDATHVFPSHDGLGSFRLDNPMIGTEAREQLYQFEQYNPRRQTRKRRESLDREEAQRQQQQPEMMGFKETQEHEKRRRIEDWRLESSRCLLEEVQKETRRRRKSITVRRKAQTMTTTTTTTTAASRKEKEEEEDGEADALAWHDEDAIEEAPEGFLSRFTRTFIKDILGLDDNMLSILTGETSMDPEEDLSSTPRASMSIQPSSAQTTFPTTNTESWQLQMLDRVSRELGALVSHLSHHPGAFSTYSRVQQMPLPYAGLAPIPETTADVTSPQPTMHASQPLIPEFHPTYRGAESSQPIDIPTRVENEDAQMGNSNNTFTKDEWEQDLDVRLIFRYLRNRFTSSSSPPHHLATNPHNFNTQESAARMARVRQHHPLTARTQRTGERNAVSGGGAVAGGITQRVMKQHQQQPGSPGMVRGQSSCASQSTRRSRSRRSSGGGSSRHYWEFGGSLGAGPLGSWGEV